MKPRVTPEEFDDQAGVYEYPKGGAMPKPPSDEPLATDEEAVNAALAWLKKHFGPWSANTTLVATSVMRSSSGNERPVYDWDRGHTIIMGHEYLGLPVQMGAVVYITGRSQYRAVIEIANMEAVEDSCKPTITKESAVRAAREMLMAQGATARELDVLDRQMQPRVEYVWSPVHNVNTGVHDEASVYSPQWVMVPQGTLMVDAHTGKPWIND